MFFSFTIFELGTNSYVYIKTQLLRTLSEKPNFYFLFTFQILTNHHYIHNIFRIGREDERLRFFSSEVFLRLGIEMWIWKFAAESHPITNIRRNPLRVDFIRFVFQLLWVYPNYSQSFNLP